MYNSDDAYTQFVLVDEDYFTLGDDFVVKYNFNGLTGYLVQHDDAPVGDLCNLLAG